MESFRDVVWDYYKINVISFARNEIWQELDPEAARE